MEKTKNSTIKQSSLSQSAMQLAEDNKKEITYIYSKLKNIGGENVKPLIEQNTTAIEQNATQIESLKTSIEQNQNSIQQNATEIENLKNNSGNLNNGSSNQGSLNSLQTLCPNYVISTGGSVYVNGLVDATTLVRKVRIHAEKECMAKITLTIRMNYSSLLTQISMITMLVNDVAIEKFHFNVPDNKGSSVSGEFITFTAFCHLNAGINIFQAFYERSETHNISISYYGLTFESSTKLEFTNNFMFYNFYNNENQFVFIHCGGYAFAHVFDDLDSYLNYNHSLEYRDTSFQSGQKNYITPLFLPVLNQETGEMEKGDLYKFEIWPNGTIYLKSYDGAYSTSNGITTIDEFICHGASEFVMDNIGGVCCIAFGDNNKAVIFRYHNSTFKFKKYVNYLEYINEIYEIDAVKTINKTPLQQPLFIIYDCNKNGYLLTVDLTQTTPEINFDSMVPISNDTFISHTYFHNNKYYSFYHKNGCVYRRIFTFENGVLNIESDQFFDYCQDLIVVNNQYVIKVYNTYPFTVEQCFYE